MQGLSGKSPEYSSIVPGSVEAAPMMPKPIPRAPRFLGEERRRLPKDYSRGGSRYDPPLPTVLSSQLRGKRIGFRLQGLSSQGW